MFFLGGVSAAVWILGVIFVAGWIFLLVGDAGVVGIHADEIPSSFFSPKLHILIVSPSFTPCVSIDT